MRKLATITVTVGAALFGLVGCNTTPTTNPITRDGTVTGIGSYRLHLDDGLGTKVRPLVLVLGGNGQTPGKIESTTGLDSYAIAHGFTVAYVTSSYASWNAGNPCCNPALAANSDDIPRITELIQAVDNRMTGRADLGRTYLWGFSNGGMMAFRYAATHAGTIAAAGSVAGPLLVPATRAARVIHMHATDDGIVPINGGYGVALPSGDPFGPFPSSYTESSRLPAGTAYRLVTYTGNHSWPANANDQLWAFTSVYRLS